MYIDGYLVLDGIQKLSVPHLELWYTIEHFPTTLEPTDHVFTNIFVELEH